ncbi:asparaginase-domain-containing protein [Sistotremastrum niveocremeum HHB9708]|uniref:asparaginase n=2 Tax=Sistotremastraceae TaxID=3402574 RepID=A0A164P508_9AGAM|nr:asparaginase-domain-containing protein [Sistotremastrum niveocremeum HHB9708]KZT39714.1 L-asparaginase [Sistotremastrum suecicum HHB10207 ss-3]
MAQRPQGVPTESNVLIIYTGGTIGMLNLIPGSSGLAPEPFFLTETLRSQTRFHDPLQDSLFSHSASAEGFRKWNASEKNSRATTPSIEPPTHSVLVRSTRPILSAANLTLKPESVAPRTDSSPEEIYSAHIPSLVTPQTIGPGGFSRRIRYAIFEWDTLIDSSSMGINDWVRIATEIDLNYSTFDAFVILQGTDTMCYTSSALSFLLEDLGKTVIITGAQIPLSQVRNDAFDNLLGALSIAGHYTIPECCLYFNHTLFRGNRVSKISSFDLDAFDSPNFAPLVNVGIEIVVNWNDILRQTGQRPFHVHKSMCSEVAILRLFPGITTSTIRAFLAPPIKGVVLETFGAGNAPQRADLMAALSEACARDVVIVAISQCAKGSVSDAYASGRELLATGVVPGGDMTPECALSKLAYLLSKPNLSVHEVRKLLQTSLRGELTKTSPNSDNTAPLNVDRIQEVLSQLVRLTSTGVSRNPPATVSAAALSSSTTSPSEILAAETALLTFLIHQAVCKDDIEGLNVSLDTFLELPHAPTGGLVDAVDPASGRSPLHVAALNGSSNCAQILLRNGALVHLRDNLDHTALYYATRQGHEEIVSLLVNSGAHLMGSDMAGASVHVQQASLHGPAESAHLWDLAGFRPNDLAQPRTSPTAPQK